MDVSQLRREFSVFVIDSDADQALPLVEAIRASGYEDTRVFPDPDIALKEAAENPPHIVLFDFEHFDALAEGFLVDLQSISPEILTVLMISADQVLPALQWVSRGLVFDSVKRPLVSTLEITQKLDRGITRLYYQFESEQLKEHLAAGDSAVEPAVEPAVEQGPSPQPAAPPPTAETVRVSATDYSALNEYLNRMSATKEIDQAVQLFMDAVSKVFKDTPMLYFKYIASHMSLLVSQTAWLPVEKIRGIGVDLKKEDPGRLPELLQNPERLASLQTLIQQVFKRDRYTAFPHIIDGEVLGLFILLDKAEVRDESGIVQTLLRIFNLAYKRNVTVKEKHSLDTIDPVTGLINRRHFSQKVDEEISRSRRILMPLSIITIDVDNIKRLNERLGFQQTDSILKMIAVILKKTARVSDIVARTGPDEITFLLPHTSHMGAAIKAERVRRIIESTRIPLIEGLGLGPLTVSCGVSEYPSFCNDSEGLLRTADEAMMQVKKAGGNKVCLATAPPGFQMDFVPREVGEHVARTEGRR